MVQLNGSVKVLVLVTVKEMKFEMFYYRTDS